VVEVPPEVIAMPDVSSPNAETLAAMEEGEELLRRMEETGRCPFRTADEMWAELDK
jgi:hypothetical protein